MLTIIDVVFAATDTDDDGWRVDGNGWAVDGDGWLVTAPAELL